VLLLAPRNRIATAGLAVVDARGTVRRVGLDGVEAGVTAPEIVAGNTTPPRSIIPALAVDGLGHAFVVPAAGPVSKVTLSSLTVRRYALKQSRTLAKGPTGPLRMAVWLPNGLLAVSGWNFGIVAGNPTATAAGLELINPRTWRFTQRAADISHLQLADGHLLASTQASAELRSYSLNGRLRYTVPGGPGAWFWGALEGRGYLAAGARTATTTSFDLATGRLVRKVAAIGTLLLGDAAPFTPAGY